MIYTLSISAEVRLQFNNYIFIKFNFSENTIKVKWFFIKIYELNNYIFIILGRKGKKKRNREHNDNMQT